MEITIDTIKGRIRIYIDGILHLSLLHEGIQIQSWKEGKDWYCIEFHTQQGKILAEYDDKDKWSKILSLIDTIN